MTFFKNFKDIPQFFDRHNLLFYFFVAVPLGFFVFLYLGNKAALENNFLIKDGLYYYKMSLVIIALIEMLVAEFMSKGMLKRVRQDATLNDKLHRYLMASLIRYIGYFSAAVFMLLGLFVFMEGIFAATYVVVLFLISLIRPTKPRMIKSGIFSKEEIEVIENDGVVK